MFKASYMKEVLRKYWPIPVVIFLVIFVIQNMSLMYFIAGADYFDPEWYYGANLYDIAINAIRSTAIMASLVPVILFWYLHSKSLSIMVHSLPVTRTQLYMTNYFVGLVMVLVPLLINGLVTVLGFINIRAAFERLEVSGYFTNPAEIEKMLPSSESVLAVVGIMLITAFLMYSLSVFAAVISGNIPAHIVTVGLLNGVVLFVACLALGMGSIYLFGFPDDALSDLLLGQLPVDSALRYLHPVLALTSGNFDSVVSVAYIALAIALAAASFLLYKKAKLERVGRIWMFDTLWTIVGIIVGLGGIVAVALFAESSGSLYGIAVLLISMIVGLILFTVCMMIAKRTRRVFDGSFAKKAISFVVVAGMLFAFTFFDASGYEKRVPAPENVKGVALNSYTMLYSLRSYDYSNPLILESKENIEALQNIQKKIISDKDSILDHIRALDFEGVTESPDLFSLYYKMEEGKGGAVSGARKYSVPNRLFAGDKDLMTIAGSQEFMDKTSLESIGYDRVTSLRIYSNDYDGDIYIKKEEVGELARTIDEDYRALSAERITQLNSGEPDKDFLALMFVGFEAEDDIPAADGLLFNPNVFFTVTDSSCALTNDFTRTIEWFKEHGYYEQIMDSRASYLEEETAYAYN